MLRSTRPASSNDILWLTEFTEDHPFPTDSSALLHPIITSTGRQETILSRLQPLSHTIVTVTKPRHRVTSRSPAARQAHRVVATPTSTHPVFLEIRGYNLCPRGKGIPAPAVAALLIANRLHPIIGAGADPVPKLDLVPNLLRVVRVCRIVDL